MSSKTLKVVLKNAVKTEAQWSTSDPIIGQGVCVYSSDKGNMYKIGDGVKTWSQLSYNVNEIINAIYPIGAIYFSVNNVNPGTIFPGTTWTAWGTGKTIVGVDSDDTNFDVVEKTGGSSNVSLVTDNLPEHLHSIPDHKHGVSITGHKHTLTASIATGGKHFHWTIRKDSGCQTVSSGGSFRGPISYKNNSEASNTTVTDTSYHDGHDHDLSLTQDTAKDTVSIKNITNLSTNNTGSGTAHSNLQPYITCYMWKRTA